MPKEKCAMKSQTKAEDMKQWMAEARERLKDVQNLSPVKEAWIYRCMQVAIDAIDAADRTFEV